jgi:hypothetical protein
MPGSRARVVAVESSAKIPRHDGREKKTEWAELPLP